MKRFTLITILLVLIILVLPTFSVMADSISHRDITGIRSSDLLPTVKVNRLDRDSDRTCQMTNNGVLVCFESPIIQDLNQCVFDTPTGTILLCLDTCGGRSQPGFICSDE
jgi:hypothetical protein